MEDDLGSMNGEDEVIDPLSSFSNECLEEAGRFRFRLKMYHRVRENTRTPSTNKVTPSAIWQDELQLVGSLAEKGEPLVSSSPRTEVCLTGVVVTGGGGETIATVSCPKS